MCVRLFLEQGYKNTSVSQIVDEAGVARGSYLNLFPTKDRILLELTETMFGGQFGVARSIADSKLPPVYAYAVETAIQLTLTELNENLREIYIEAYSLPDTSEYIYLHTTAELKQIFGVNFPDNTESDFYEMEIGTAGLMRSYMARKCDIHFPLERKLSRCWQQCQHHTAHEQDAEQSFLHVDSSLSSASSMRIVFFFLHRMQIMVTVTPTAKAAMPTTMYALAPPRSSTEP